MKNNQPTVNRQLRIRCGQTRKALRRMQQLQHYQQRLLKEGLDKIDYAQERFRKMWEFPER
ncbi:hypothetical protein [Chitinophaga sp. 22620]|jgi:hypothetical protein|uniref:hypothetical protein n=1 Tax=Chitinophaga sp. 22620 TaxID=3453952 RepID=UPI003F842D4B